MAYSLISTVSHKHTPSPTLALLLLKQSVTRLNKWQKYRINGKKNIKIITIFSNCMLMACIINLPFVTNFYITPKITQNQCFSLTKSKTCTETIFQYYTKTILDTILYLVCLFFLLIGVYIIYIHRGVRFEDPPPPGTNFGS